MLLNVCKYTKFAFNQRIFTQRYTSGHLITGSLTFAVYFLFLFVLQIFEIFDDVATSSCTSLGKDSFLFCTANLKLQTV